MAEAFVLVRHGRLSLADMETMTRAERIAYADELIKYSKAIEEAARPRK